ncbi:AraC family transcriptional regulator [soil metagenome]
MKNKTAFPDSWRRATVDLLLQLAPNEGYNVTAFDDVRLLRSNRPLSNTPVLYEPGIVFVCQGRKRGHLGDKRVVYDAQQYLAVAVPLPFTMETDATEAEPLLAIYIRLDAGMAADLSIRLPSRPPSSAKALEGMASSPVDAPMALSVLRLLQAMTAPLEAALLGSSLIREIYFRVLSGDQGEALRAALATQGQFGKIAKALEHIHSTFDTPIDVEQLASKAAMSVASFHAHFKRVTALSPMQYVKSTRLHQARLLLVRNDMTAAHAAASVGYESASQFSREFHRLFGLPPIREAARLRTAYALPAASGKSTYVSSH